MDELLGEQHAAGLRNGDGRGPDVTPEQTAQLPLADLEPGGEGGDVCLVQGPALNQLQCARHRCRSAAPRIEVR